MTKLSDKIKTLYTDPVPESEARLWSIFLSARIALALILVLIQCLLHLLQDPWTTAEGNRLQIGALTVYLVETIVMLWLLHKTLILSKNKWILWLLTAGLDLLIFFWLYWGSIDSTGFFMLFIFSALMVATLGPRWLLYVLCGAITLFISIRAGIFTGEFYRTSFHIRNLIPQLLGCGGILIIGELTLQLAARMRKEESRAFAGLSSAKQQEGLNRLIVSEMSMGVVVGDEQGQLKMINPAAVVLITGNEDAVLMSELSDSLEGELGWSQLQGVMKILFESEISNRWLVFDFMLEQGEHGACTLQIKGRILNSEDSHGQSLCVLFLTDLRDADRRMQQEKLAAMGRISASIAHEIRNPLATIASANTLLSEGLSDKASLRLSEMIATNANRLNQIVKDVLDVSHLEVHGNVEAIDLLFALPEMVHEWSTLYNAGNRLHTFWPDDVFGVFISFDEEHLRRVINNLLDNALRYASHQKGAIYVTLKVFQVGESEKVRISIFSDGESLGSKVERALFEPFFSTESRGTGLGLYICRNLCNRYDADLEYWRTTLDEGESERSYNEFYITTNRVDPLPGETQVMLEQVKYPGYD